MSGMRNFIYLNKRSKTPAKWEDISCSPLEMAVNVFTGLCVVGIILGILFWCMK